MDQQYNRYQLPSPILQDICGRLFEEVVTAPSVQAFEARLDKAWNDQPLKFHYKEDLILQWSGYRRFYPASAVNSDDDDNDDDDDDDDDDEYK